MTTLFYVTASVCGVLFVLALMGPQHDDLRFAEIHHGHFGLLLILAAMLGAWSWLGWVGVVVLADDTMQHGIQRWARRPAYRSPLHRLYGVAYRWPPVRRLNQWLDRRLGQ